MLRHFLMFREEFRRLVVAVYEFFHRFQRLALFFFVGFLLRFFMLLCLRRGGLFPRAGLLDGRFRRRSGLLLFLGSRGRFFPFLGKVHRFQRDCGILRAAQSRVHTRLEALLRVGVFRQEIGKALRRLEHWLQRSISARRTDESADLMRRLTGRDQSAIGRNGFHSHIRVCRRVDSRHDDHSFPRIQQFKTTLFLITYYTIFSGNEKPANKIFVEKSLLHGIIGRCCIFACLLIQ